MQRLESHGAADRILNGQRQILNGLLIEPRLHRMAEHANRDRSHAYLPADLIGDLHDGIFAELKADPIAIDLYRRNLQRLRRTARAGRRTVEAFVRVVLRSLAAN